MNYVYVYKDIFTFIVHDLVTFVAAVTVPARLNAISLHMSDESAYTK